MYFLLETKVIGEYKTKKEALQDCDNNIMWYPENNFKVVDKNNKVIDEKISH